ncbi:hypothetical protein EDB19DRAFT_1805292 [Suillus lakei]|nr:hypothetical protein EDB19DRAFT_1805292 [Suillus lakei]
MWTVSLTLISLLSYIGAAVVLGREWGWWLQRLQSGGCRTRSCSLIQLPKQYIYIFVHQIVRHRHCSDKCCYSLGCHLTCLLGISVLGSSAT